MRLTTVVSIVAALAVVTWLTGPAGAKKPVKPPPEPPPALDTGTVYYLKTGVPSRMDPDGENKQTILDYVDGLCEPSVARHGPSSERWFLLPKKIPGETYPDDSRRYEIYAVSESGTTVLLTDDESLQPVPQYGLCPRWSKRGSVVDGRISYVAYRWTLVDGDWVTSPGLYVLDVDPENLGSHQATAPQAVENLDIVLRYDWSPDGSWIVFSGESKLWKASAVDGFASWTALTDGWALNPRISADGNRIAFETTAGIEVMDASGSNREVIVEDPRDTKKETRKVSLPAWSPGGTHLIYMSLVISTGGSRSDVYRCEDDGGGQTDLTSEADSGYCVPLAWRADN
jgi:hypothetical protein